MRPYHCQYCASNGAAARRDQRLHLEQPLARLLHRAFDGDHHRRQRGQSPPRRSASPAGPRAHRRRCAHCPSRRARGRCARADRVLERATRRHGMACRPGVRVSPAVGELLERVLARRFEQAVARPRLAFGDHERLVDQAAQSARAPPRRRCARVAATLCALRARSCRRTRRAGGRPRARRRRAARGSSRARRAASGGARGATREPPVSTRKRSPSRSLHAGHAEHRHARRGELDRQRQPVEPAADLDHRAGDCRRSARSCGISARTRSTNSAHRAVCRRVADVRRRAAPTAAPAGTPVRRRPSAAPGWWRGCAACRRRAAAARPARRPRRRRCSQLSSTSSARRPRSAAASSSVGSRRPGSASRSDCAIVCTSSCADRSAPPARRSRRRRGRCRRTALAAASASRVLPMPAAPTIDTSAWRSSSACSAAQSASLSVQARAAAPAGCRLPGSRRRVRLARGAWPTAARRVRRRLRPAA